ncbi:MAG: DNA polymerase III subunit gamma/tau [Hyphomicrobiaceae bacterium]|nr:DNA polymerase III subunit gamma/tau [Hyphomicrobiaceae bacterium]
MAKHTSPPTDLLGESQAAPAAKEPYVVLARKYRPETFEQLIGQDAMVTTLKNAFAADRIAQGYMLTGVRGVGKTTTARILARALNYAKPGLPDRPTMDMDGYGEHCLEIIQSRHPDVIEMDAASNTGVDNMREIIENARYRPILARTKVFIVDEVHMLSKSAFNALLKTLEEPPGHVKFIFATTEVRKVPVTVLSRCQRFDLRRVDSRLLAAHFKSILAAEDAEADDEALALIARASGGSVRDGLSILDQAIAMGAGKVTVPAVRAMLGLADRARVFDLVEALMRGAAGDALGQIERLHRDGADPAQILAELAEAVHAAARIKIVGEGGAAEDLSAEDRLRAASLGRQLSIPVLTRAWQMLQKGFDEASRAADPLQAAEMVLIRIAHAAELPSPDDLIRLIGTGAGRERAGSPPPRPRQEGERPQAGPTARTGLGGDRPPPATGPSAPDATGPQSFQEVVALAGEHRDARLKVHLEEHVRLVRFEPGRLEIHLIQGCPPGLAGELGEKLGRWTGRRWVVAVSREAGEPPIAEVRRQREAAELAEIKTHPAVQALLDVFPEAEITTVRPLPGAPRDESKAG